MSHSYPASGSASERFIALGRASRSQLEQTLLRGNTPDLDSLVGWEFCGMNTPAWSRLLGIKKFIKGFYRPSGNPGEVYGYNCPVVQSSPRQPWRMRPSNAEPRRFGFYQVYPVDPTARDNTYLHAVLLDYSRGQNHPLDPGSRLRDYLVQVDRDNPDLYLGKTYYALGSARVAVSFFVLERQHRAPDDPFF